jgi:hypothetical protein
MTTTDSDGGFTLMVPVLANNFIRASATGHKTQQQGAYLLADGGNPSLGGPFDMSLITVTEFTTVAGALNPPLTPDPTKGFFIIEWRGAVTIPGLFGADLSLAHGSTFSIDQTTGMPPFYTDGGMVMMNGGTPLIFPNVAAGMTTVTLHPVSGSGCQLDPPFTNWRVDADTFTRAVAQCQ